MNLARCKQGHFYDTDSHDNCPHCLGGNIENKVLTMPLTSGDSSSEVTERFSQENNASVSPPIDVSNLQDAVKKATSSNSSIIKNDDDSKTISFYGNTLGSEPVVGWLVCVLGEHYGEDFRLKSGRNFIGRASTMDVVISKDITVSREKHAIVVYEPRNQLFIVQPGDSKELCYLNDSVVLQPQEIKINDILTVGETNLMFFPCCSKEFNWEIMKNKNEAFSK